MSGGGGAVLLLSARAGGGGGGGSGWARLQARAMGLPSIIIGEFGTSSQDVSSSNC